MIFFLILIGLVTGLLAGLLGIGGGVITVPALYYLLPLIGIPQEFTMHISIATALGATFLTSLGSTWSHFKRGAILFTVLKLIIPGLLLGCITGSMLTSVLSTNVLKGIFGVITILLGIYFILPRLPPLHLGKNPNYTLIFFGFGVGCLSTLLGVGGGIFLVPILIGYKVPIKNSIAISSAGTLSTALFGTLIYLYIGWGEIRMPEILSYIYLPGFLIIGLCSLITARWGVKLAHTLNTELIKKIFAVVLIFTGFAMIFSR